VEKTAVGGSLFDGVKTGAPDSGDGRLIELRRWPSSYCGGCPITGREVGFTKGLLAAGEGEVCIGEELVMVCCTGVP
jgi:hypothetical protein